MNKFPLKYELNAELLKLLGQTYEKLGEYKSVLKTYKYDFKILLNLFLLKECISTLTVDEEEYTVDDILFINYVKETKKIKKLKNIMKLYNSVLIEAKSKDKFDIQVFNHFHKLLFNGIRGLKVKVGAVRRKQNYITKTGLVGKSIIYVPPKYNELTGLMKNLLEYLNESLQDEPFIKLALIHYQFESIHPYMIGNGIIGRSLISALFTKYKAEKPILFISEALNKYKTTYYSSFNESANNVEIFIRFFMQSVIEQCNLNIIKIPISPAIKYKETTKREE